MTDEGTRKRIGFHSKRLSQQDAKTEGGFGKEKKIFYALLEFSLNK
jgi:hypothetical protein